VTQVRPQEGDATITLYAPRWPSPAAARLAGLVGRDASAKVLNAIAKRVPWLVGGSADLTPSTKTRLTFDGAGDLSATNPGGRNLHFGVREHAMGAVLNGLALAKLRAYGSGFLIFSDYARGAIRLSALMEIPSSTSSRTTPSAWARTAAFGVWVRVLLATNAASLVVDYADVVRYLLGDRG
jgi:hypothetical protein